MGAASNADKETRILKLKAYLDQADPYNSLEAIKACDLSSWTTFISYLNYIQKRYDSSLTDLGRNNFVIAKREAEYLKKLQAK